MSTKTDTDLTPTEKRRRDRYEARNKANAERIAANAARAAAAADKARREGRGRDIPGCLLCGRPDPETTFKEGRPGAGVRNYNPGLFGVWPALRGRLCSPCDAAMERGRMKASLGGTDQHTGRSFEPTLADVIAVTDRLDSERADYRPEDEVLTRRHLQAITWAGAVRAAWAADRDMPTLPKMPFGHLPKSWGKIEFPPEPETPVHKPKLNPRRVEGGCGLCGVDVPSSAAVMAHDPRAWGLDSRGGMVEVAFCTTCRAASSDAPTGEGVPLGVVYALHRRLDFLKPGALPKMEAGEFIHPAELVGKAEPTPWTFANFTIAAREFDLPDPNPGEPFWWIAVKAKPGPAPKPTYTALAAALAARKADK